MNVNNSILGDLEVHSSGGSTKNKNGALIGLYEYSEKQYINLRHSTFAFFDMPI